MTFLSNQPGLGDDVTWTETLPRDPDGRADREEARARTWPPWFQLSLTPWYSMAMCDPNSYPQAPCTPESRTPTRRLLDELPAVAVRPLWRCSCPHPGFAPFADSISCDNTHWCAALTIDSLECTTGFATCNNSCEEPFNFGFIQRNGVPTGPPARSTRICPRTRPTQRR